jgi:Xaa-Pro aminopeptidase
VSAVLIYADTLRSPELRHELPLPVPDPVLYVEIDGRRAVLASSFELERIKAAAPGVEAFAPDHFGAHELLTGGMSFDETELEVAVRCCNELGVTSGSVPWSFPLELADHLRAHGIDIYADRQLFDERRRRKNASEIAGLRRAQKACEAALDVARDMLRRAEPNGVLTLGGEPLTSERIKLEIERVFSEHGVVGDEFIVSHGAQTAVGHEMGSGALRPNEPIVFDLFPRDRETGVYSDMTRTYVVGEPGDEVREYHRLVREALERTTAAARPGVNGRELMQLACDLFNEHGYKTQLHKEPGEVLDSGFFHGLGHGVGLEVHEKPALSRAGDDLVPGDVITLEPGLYRAGYGGVRLEDILIVTEDGAEVVTDYPYDLAP